MSRRSLANLSRVASVTLAGATTLCAYAQLSESYYLHVANYPLGETLWSNDAQGVAHDENNWFITDTELIFKIPVQHDLRTVSLASSGVLLRDLAEYSELSGFHHIGDPVVYRFGTSDYLLVPIEGPGMPGSIAVFHCANLAYIDHASLNQVGDAGWCAVDNDGTLYSSRQHTHGIFRYSINWQLLQTQDTLSIQYLGSSALYDEQNQFLDLTTMQGGEFAPNGGPLYLVSGFYDDDNGLEDREGIHVMEKFIESNGNPGWRRIQHSTRGFGHFNYYYDPGFPTYEEPEGLTIWDLDDGRAPSIKGQLHVFVSDNDHNAGDIDFKHYTDIIQVNPVAPCLPGFPQGSPTCPFHTINAAVNFAWQGAEVRLRAGTYGETVTINKRVRLSSENGSARIGG